MWSDREMEEAEYIIPTGFNEDSLILDKIEEAPNVKHKVERKKSVAIEPASDVDQSKKESKTLPVARKRIIIMSTDTIVVKDTTHVKHRIKE